MQAKYQHSCRCEDDAFHSGRSCIEGYAEAIRQGEGYTLTAKGCADVLHFLRGIEPMEDCSYTNGTMEHAGFCRVIAYVEDALRELPKEAQS
jgi:hypothetical protein